MAEKDDFFAVLRDKVESLFAAVYAADLQLQNDAICLITSKVSQWKSDTSNGKVAGETVEEDATQKGQSKPLEKSTEESAEQDAELEEGSDFLDSQDGCQVSVPWSLSWLECEVKPTGFVGQHFRKFKKAGIARCITCQSDIAYSKQGLCKLIGHMKSSKHIDKSSMEPEWTTETEEENWDEAEIDKLCGVSKPWSNAWLDQSTNAGAKLAENIVVFKEPGLAFCKLCQQVVQYSDAGVDDLINHVEGRIHIRMKNAEAIGEDGNTMKEFDESHNINIPWEWQWLVHKVKDVGYAGKYFRKFKKAGVVRCINCQLDVSYHAEGVDSLVKHVESDKHKIQLTMFPRQQFDNEETLYRMDDIDKYNKIAWPWKWEWSSHVTDSQEKIGDHIIKFAEPGVAYCELCCTVIRYGAQGLPSLIQHIELEKHRSQREELLHDDPADSVPATVKPSVHDWWGPDPDDMHGLDRVHGIRYMWNWRWMGESVKNVYLGEVYRKHKEPGSVNCVICSIDIKYGVAGFARLTDHMNTNRHHKRFCEWKEDKVGPLDIPSHYGKEAPDEVGDGGLHQYSKRKCMWLEDMSVNGQALGATFRKFMEPGVAICIVCHQIVRYTDDLQSLAEHLTSIVHVRHIGLEEADLDNSTNNTSSGEAETGGRATAMNPLIDLDIEYLNPEEAAEKGEEIDKNGKCKSSWIAKWNSECLEGEYVRDHIRKARVPGLAFCILCLYKIKYASGGITRITDHMKTKRHQASLVQKGFGNQETKIIKAYLDTLDQPKQDGDMQLKAFFERGTVPYMCTDISKFERAVQKAGGSWEVINAVIKMRSERLVAKSIVTPKVRVKIQKEAECDTATEGDFVACVPDIDSDDAENDVNALLKTLKSKQKQASTPDCSDRKVRRSTRSSRGKNSTWSEEEYLLGYRRVKVKEEPSEELDTITEIPTDNEAMNCSNESPVKSPRISPRKRKISELAVAPSKVKFELSDTPKAKQQKANLGQEMTKEVTASSTVGSKDSQKHGDSTTRKTAIISAPLRNRTPSRRHTAPERNFVVLKLDGKTIHIPHEKIPALEDEDAALTKYKDVQYFLKYHKFSLGCISYPMLVYLKERGLVPEHVQQPKKCYKFNKDEICRLDVVVEGDVNWYKCRCDTCNFKSRHRSEVYFHEKELHKEDKLFACPVCQLKFVKLPVMSAHLATHEEEKCPCPQCPHIARSNKLLQAHVKTVHDNTGVICDLCGATLRSANSLKEHLNIHYDKKPFVCSLCGLAFNSNSRLATHKRIHMERKFQCSTCGKRFINSSKLRLHSKVHSGEKPYPCPMCNYRSYTRDNLKKHCKGKHGLDLPRLRSNVWKYGDWTEPGNQSKAVEIKVEGMAAREETVMDDGEVENEGEISLQIEANSDDDSNKQNALAVAALETLANQSLSAEGEEVCYQAVDEHGNVVVLNSDNIANAAVEIDQSAFVDGQLVVDNEGSETIILIME